MSDRTHGRECPSGPKARCRSTTKAAKISLGWSSGGTHSQPVARESPKGFVILGTHLNPPAGLHHGGTGLRGNGASSSAFVASQTRRRHR